MNALILALLFFSSCTTYKVDPNKDLVNYTPRSTRSFLHKAIESGFDGIIGCGTNYKNVWWITSDRIIVRCSKPGDTEERVFKFADYPDPVADNNPGLQGYACVKLFADSKGCHFYWKGAHMHSWATETVKSWYVQARIPQNDPAEETRFNAAAETYLRADPKPALPESVIRLKAQAEHAIREKRFYDAVDLYQEALTITPWWSAGHNNCGLLQAELRDYGQAAKSFQRYLKLDPSNPNARAIQTRIYELEGLAAK